MTLHYLKDGYTGRLEPLHSYKREDGKYTVISTNSREEGFNLPHPNHDRYYFEQLKSLENTYDIEVVELGTVSKGKEKINLYDKCNNEKVKLYNQILFYVLNLNYKEVFNIPEQFYSFEQTTLAKFNLMFFSAVNKFFPQNMDNILNSLASKNLDYNYVLPIVEYQFKETILNLKSEDLISNNLSEFKYVHSIDFHEKPSISKEEFHPLNTSSKNPNIREIRVFLQSILFNTENVGRTVKAENTSGQQKFKVENSNSICPFLGIKADSLDHKTPLSVGGIDSEENYIMLSKIENTVKGSLSFEEYTEITEKYFLEINKLYTKVFNLDRKEKNEKIKKIYRNEMENIFKYKRSIILTLSKNKLFGENDKVKPYKAMSEYENYLEGQILKSYLNQVNSNLDKNILGKIDISKTEDGKVVIILDM